MKKVDYFTPMSPTDWDEFPRGSTRFDADIPLATEEDYEWEDPDPIERPGFWDQPVAPTHSGKKKLKKLLRQSKEELLVKQEELTCTKRALIESEQRNAELRQSLAHERHARSQAELENTSRQVALIMSEAIRRGQAAEAFQDLAFGGTDALLSRGRWLFQGGNLDRTVPHRKPRPDGYLLPDKDWRILDDKNPEYEREGGEKNDWV